MTAQPNNNRSYGNSKCTTATSDLCKAFPLKIHKLSKKYEDKVVRRGASAHGNTNTVVA